MPFAQIGNQESAQPAKESQVQSEMRRQGRSIERLTDLCGTLHNRLESVLRAVPPTPVQTGNKEKIALVGHASALANQSDQLENLCAAVSDVLDRLEL